MDAAQTNMASRLPWNEVARDDFSHLANPGMAIQQLLKMKARGDITLEQFLAFTAEAQGQHEERPIVLDSTPAQTAAAPAASIEPQSTHVPRERQRERLQEQQRPGLRVHG